jgi:hypothetical protein
MKYLRIYIYIICQNGILKIYLFIYLFHKHCVEVAKVLLNMNFWFQIFISKPKKIETPCEHVLSFFSQLSSFDIVKFFCLFVC